MQYIFHHFQTLLFDGKLHTAPLKDDIENALNVATSTGLWAVDFADEYPKCNVYGTDISLIQPSWLTGVIKDWTALYKEAYKCMKPGAWIEHIDAEVNLVCHDGTMPKESAINQWGEIWSEVGRKTGLVFNMVNSGCMENGTEKAGFTNIQVKDYLAPCSPWPEDAKAKEIGLYQYVFLIQDIEGFLNYFIGRIMNWSDKEMATYSACLRKEYRDRKIHAYFKWRVVLAQKPLDA
ncbi:hypothetical protein QBC32DRAFT_356394 [Pseudoneurospora amorphoporcata]|uniref:Uncharacterized protein n=1 Tax=Pseudoneurospora amorphoporcata TaxID=241081 RepID=A0AAN6NJS3_9PEZI|nr:hypothetical protein QBC32DRAFT_356394 [Pseudoneurospora amorphoporcata]